MLLCSPSARAPRRGGLAGGTSDAGCELGSEVQAAVMQPLAASIISAVSELQGLTGKSWRGRAAREGPDPSGGGRACGQSWGQVAVSPSPSLPSEPGGLPEGPSLCRPQPAAAPGYRALGTGGLGSAAQPLPPSKGRGLFPVVPSLYPWKRVPLRPGQASAARGAGDLRAGCSWGSGSGIPAVLGREGNHCPAPAASPGAMGQRKPWLFPPIQ